MSRPFRARVGWRFHARLNRVTLCLAFLCMSGARDAAAAELIVEWNAPAECPDQDHVVASVERALGEGSKANLTAIAHVTRIAGGFRAQLRITSAAGFGHRDLEDTRCEILAESLALVIALSAARSTEARSATTRAGQDRGLELGMSAHAAASVGPLPDTALGAGVTFAVEGSGVRLELGGTYHARQTATFARERVGGRFDLLRFGARGCRLWRLGDFELGPCLGTQLYRIAAMGFGGMVSRPGASTTWAPALGAFGRLRLVPHFAVQLAADAVFPLSRQRFVFSDVGLLHRPSVVTFQLFVAPEVLF